MVTRIFKQLSLSTNASLKRACGLNYLFGNIPLASTLNSGRRSSLIFNLPALTFATLITIKLPPVISTTHNTEYCSSYSSSCGDRGNEFPDAGNPGSDMKSSPSEDSKKNLSPLQYHVTQEAGTEQAFTGKYYDHWKPGTYTCVVCGADLFESEAKYNSGSGWPSFYSPYATAEAQHSVVTVRDKSHGMVRDEVRCRKCGSHLGHVFDDGPPPTGLRYCINSAALNFKDKEQ